MQVYMACIHHGHRIGVSYYDSSIRQLNEIEVWDDGSSDFPLIELVKYQAKPVIIYTSTKTEESFLSALQQSDGMTEAPTVKLVKSSIFTYEQAWHRYQKDSKIHSDTFWDKFLKLDAAAHEALQIFQVDKHPSHMGIGRAKEGFSVFGTMNKCVTPMGRRLLSMVACQTKNTTSCTTVRWSRVVDLVFSYVINLLFSKLIAFNGFKISFFLSSEELVVSLRETLKSVKDVPHILKSVCSLLHVNKIFEVGISENLREHMEYLNLDIVAKASSCITADLAYVYELVIGVINVNRSKEKGYETLVKEGFCDELDELRQIYEELPEFLEEVSSLELAQLPHLCKEKFAPCIVYIYQIGYLMCFFEEKPDEITQEKLQDFEFAFSDCDGETKRFFYRTPKTRELDDLLGDIYHKILDMERAIIRDLVSRVLMFSTHLHKTVNFASELDCFLSLAMVARQNNYVRPTLTMETFLDIQNGRHVLQEMTVDTFIPNDTKILDEGRIHIITGPNYSGKSIYIKQVALIVFLSHIGSFVPADAATVGLTDSWSRQSCFPFPHDILCNGKQAYDCRTIHVYDRSASSGNDAKQVNFHFLIHDVDIFHRQATSRSLCLLDEFGKGTLTEDGIGLLGGTINHFVTLDVPPKVLVCTHLTELFNEIYLPKSEKINFYTMSVLRPDDNSTNVEDVIFLYRLQGKVLLVSKIFRINCTVHVGVPEEVINRAALILDATENNKNVERLCNEKISAKDQQYKSAVDKMLVFDLLKGDLSAFFRDI
ncbi:hypothetical protein CRYUN_Cryun39dG0019000 [Craigia yunnanensis]